MDSSNTANKPSTSTEQDPSRSRPKRVVSTASRNYESHLEDLIGECLDKSDSDDSNQDPDYVIESIHDSDSEQEMSENENERDLVPPSADDEVNLQGLSQENELVQHGEPDLVNRQQTNGEETVERCEDNNHVDEIIQSVIDGAGDPMDIQDNREEQPIRRRGTNLFFYGKPTKTKPAFKSKKTLPPSNTRTRHNIITHIPGLKTKAKNLGDSPSPVEVWELLVTQNMLHEILRWTNGKIRAMKLKYDNQNLTKLRGLYLQEVEIIQTPFLFKEKQAMHLKCVKVSL